MIMNGGAVRRRAPVHMDMRCRARAFPEETLRVPGRFILHADARRLLQTSQRPDDDRERRRPQR